ncbi:hypothetical protein LPJ66_002997 [Kickxella alabastrina]|uniref:Uncharacterized protein n=1 Tax=Kickxella alabastrina TaxID=61397 RepID=A0ACC1INM2_9FUNG|nr:hypothetical protein LPJ66_002997 [Kickxella alabastrina]
MLSFGVFRQITGRSLTGFPTAFPAVSAMGLGRRLMSTGGPGEGSGDSGDAASAAASAAAAAANKRAVVDRRLQFANSLSSQISNTGSQVVGRSVPVAAGSAVKAYGRLNRILSENNVRRELSLRKRYEKPKYKRQRLKREGHARRFKEEVRKKVHLIMQMKNWGM